MFSDESFGGIEDLFNQLAGGARNSGRAHKTSAVNLLNVIDEKKKAYFIFDLSGKSEIKVDIQDELEVDDYDEEFSTGQKVLEIKASKEETLNYILPKGLKKNNMSYATKNGILEVEFKK